MSTVHAVSGPSKEMQTESYWTSGCLAVYAHGADAGAMRLDMDFPQFDTVDQVLTRIRLTLPGETFPLEPTDAVGEDGRFVVSFFSSDIANAGHLPAEATVSWGVDDGDSPKRSVPVVSADRIARTESPEAASIPGRKTSDTYPRTIGLLTLVSLFLLGACAAVFMVL